MILYLIGTGTLGGLFGSDTRPSGELRGCASSLVSIGQKYPIFKVETESLVRWASLWICTKLKENIFRELYLFSVLISIVPCNCIQLISLQFITPFQIK